MSRVSEFLSSLQPFEGRYRCPDCNADSLNGQPAQHDPTCWVGLGIDEICAVDREFFEAFPEAGSIVRQPHRAELAEFRMLGEHGDITGVRVTAFDGFRSRQPITGGAL